MRIGGYTGTSLSFINNSNAFYKRWVREETRTMENDALEPEYDRMVHVALKALRERPVYLAYAVFLLYFIFKI